MGEGAEMSSGGASCFFHSPGSAFLILSCVLAFLYFEVKPFGVNLTHGYSESSSWGVHLMWFVLPPKGNATSHHCQGLPSLQ